MKKQIIIISSILLAAVLLCSCNEAETPEGTTFFEFAKTEITVPAGRGSGTIDVTWERETKRGAILELYVTTSGIANPASENTDFTVVSKTLTFGNDDKEQTVTINIPNANAADGGDIAFFLVMRSSSAKDVGLGRLSKDNNKCLVTITAGS